MRKLSNRSLKPENVFKEHDSYDYLLSQSQLTVFQGCDLSWFLDYALKLEAPDKIFPGTIAGTSWHVMFEQYINEGQKTSKVELNKTFLFDAKKEFIKHKEKGTYLYFTLDKFAKDNYGYAQFLTSYITKKPVFTKYKKIDAEFPILLQYNDYIWIRGFIDVVGYNKDGTVDLWDWKTTSQWKERTPETDLQMQLFSVCFEKITGLKVKNFGYWVFQKKPKMKIFTREFPVDISELEYYLNDFIDKFYQKVMDVDIEPVDKTNKHAACTFCKFKGYHCRNYKTYLNMYKTKKQGKLIV